MASLLTINCNSCGAPLKVSDTARFITCTHCSTQLQVQHSGGAVYTEILGQIAEQTREMAGDLETMTVGSVMSTNVVTCAAGDGVDRLMALMTDRRIRHLPVVDDHGHLRGIVSIGDVVKARLTELEHENRALADYISGR